MKMKFDSPTIMSLLFSVSAALTFCVPDPPHKNPLDPYHTESGLRVFGYTLKKNNPHEPLDSCLLFLTPRNYFTTSDITGQFVFENIVPGFYQVITFKSHYQTDTTNFYTDSVTSQPLLIYLNGLPFIKRIFFYSRYIDQWWPDPYHEIVLNLTADDPDGIDDLQEIRLTIPELDINNSLIRSTRIDSFSISLQDISFPNENISNIIGKEVFINLIENSGSTQIEGPFFIHRIIETSPIPLYPTGLASVNNQPILKWLEFSASFNFQYEIQIFRIVAGIPNLIYYHKDIPSTQTEYHYQGNLTAGQYFWVIWVKDELGNLSRSKEASFQVQ